MENQLEKFQIKYQLFRACQVVNEIVREEVGEKLWPLFSLGWILSSSG